MSFWASNDEYESGDLLSGVNIRRRIHFSGFVHVVDID